VLPIGDENVGQRIRPLVNQSLIALNVLVFLYQLTLSDRQLFEFFRQWGTVPREIADGRDLFALVTCMFLHGGWLHIGGNMLFLWVFGDNIEDTMGHLSYGLFYLLCGVGASLLQVLVNSESGVPLVGASGAISGVLGAYLVLYPHGKIKTLVLALGLPLVLLFPAYVQIGFWVLLQFVNGFASLGVRTAETGGGVAYFAHIGGFLAGLVLVWLFRNPDAQARQLAARHGRGRVIRGDWRLP
jgi:membrane associated rhomboid family serine protease